MFIHDQAPNFVRRCHNALHIRLTNISISSVCGMVGNIISERHLKLGLARNEKERNKGEPLPMHIRTSKAACWRNAGSIRENVAG